MLSNLFIILDNLRFPENAGMAARACANMGAPNLYLVRPRNWDPLKAAPTATSCGKDVLNRLKIFDNLEDALSDCHAVYASSARTGGWHENCRPPSEICALIAPALSRGEKLALLFGPEDSGLDNHALSLCSGIIHIDTECGASSLNIAQALLLVLYELRMRCVNERICARASKPASFAECQLLESRFKGLLEELGCLAGKNPDYAFRIWHDFIARKGLMRHEYDAFMGLVRQIGLLLDKCQQNRSIASR